jgi:hypothetical protein
MGWHRRKWSRPQGHTAPKFAQAQTLAKEKSDVSKIELNKPTMGIQAAFCGSLGC